MKNTSSPWRTRARQVIRKVLADLKPGTSYAEIRRAISKAYPFGERAMHPYRCWLIEVREVLRSFEEEAYPGETKRGYRLVDRGGKRPWLEVCCDWCHGRVKGGCLC